jgi:LEA14-like dessication related protein
MNDSDSKAGGAQTEETGGPQTDVEGAQTEETGSTQTEETEWTPRRIGKYVGGGILALIGLVVLLFVLGVIGIPDGSLENNEWGEVDNDSIEVITTVQVDNPNPIGANADVEYDVTMQGVELAEGEGSNLDVSPGSNQLELRTDLFQDRLPAWWSSHLNNGEVSALAVNATIDASAGPLSGSHDTTIEDEIDTDIEGALNQSFARFEGRYPEDTPTGTPAVEMRDVTTRWGEVNESTTEIRTEITIHNPNRAAPIPTPAFTGSLVFNDIPIAEWDAGDVELASAPGDATVPPGETEQRTLVVVMDNQNIPDWFASHVERNESTEMVIGGQFSFDIGGREVTIPPGDRALECQFDLTTAIFVDQETSVDFQGCAGPTAGNVGGNGVDDTVPGDDEGNGVLPASDL